MQVLRLSQASPVVEATAEAACWTPCRVLSQASSATFATEEAICCALSLTAPAMPPAEDPSNGPIPDRCCSGKRRPRSLVPAIMHLLLVAGVLGNIPASGWCKSYAEHPATHELLPCQRTRAAIFPACSLPWANAGGP